MGTIPCWLGLSKVAFPRLANMVPDGKGTVSDTYDTSSWSEHTATQSPLSVCSSWSTLLPLNPEDVAYLNDTYGDIWRHELSVGR